MFHIVTHTQWLCTNLNDAEVPSQCKVQDTECKPIQSICAVGKWHQGRTSVVVVVICNSN